MACRGSKILGLQIKLSIMQSTIDKQKKQLLKRFYTLLGVVGCGNDEKALILSQYGVESSRDLSVSELAEICKHLANRANPKLEDGDKWRKRVMASIGAWLRDVNIEQSPVMIKAIACRASGYPHFNAIPVARLRDVYYEFVRKAKTVAGVQEFKQQITQYLETYN